MAEVTPEQLRFQQASSLPGPSLLSFYTEQQANLLPNCLGSWPDFFNHNLVSPYRVLKLFQDSPHSNLRVFYYQLLRVSYEVETEQGFNRSFIYNLIQIIFSEGFEVFFTTDTDSQRDLYNDQQFKKLFAEFINLLESQGVPQVEKALNSYPIMDTVLVHILRSILASQDINFPFNSKIPTETVIGELSGLLGLVVQAFGNNCWKFDDSDMFCYEDNDNELYLAFIIDAGVVTSEEASQEPLPVLQGHLDSATTQTIQLDSNYRQEISSRDYSRPLDLNIADTYTASAYAPSSLTYESRVEDITYKPAASLGLASSYENPLSYSLAQSNFQSSSYSQDPLFKSSAGAYGTPNFEPLSRPAGNAFAFDLGIKPSSAYVVPDYKPSYEPISIAGDINSRYGGSFTSSSFSAGLEGGDYYNDFTNDRLLEKLEQPFRSKVAQIKSRVRGWKRAQAPAAGAVAVTSYSSSFGLTTEWTK